MKRRQQGIAVITALLLTALAVTIVSGLFWQQQVQLRLLDNQRLLLQQGWLMRGTLDWACLVLRDDARLSNVDYRGETWSQTLAATPSVDVGAGATVLVRSEVDDAQARFNLRNLAANGEIDREQMAIFTRLLTALRIDPQLARLTAEAIALRQRRVAAGSPVAAMRIWQVEDLLTVSGFSADMLPRLQDTLVILPRATAINLNTASAQMLAARFDNLSQSDAAALVASRQRAYFRDAADFAQRLPGRVLSENAGELAFASNFFVVRSTVDVNQVTLQSLALVERTGAQTRVLWNREGEPS